MKATILPITAQDYRDLPEGGPRYQLIEGDLLMAPAPTTTHQKILLRVAFILQQHLEDHPLGELMLAPFDLYLTDINVYQPDLVFVARESAALVRKDGIHGGPELVVEILSPSTRQFDLGPKKRIYARCGVLEFWALDPDTRRVEVFDLRASESEPAGTFREGDEFSCRFFPGLSILTTKLFPPAE